VEKKLLRPGQRVLVAVSGGADSVALAHALHRLRRRLDLRLVLAHLHHGIRGRAADADAAFVRRLARRLGLPLIAERADVPALARAAGVSLEMAARQARYEFLLRAARQTGADAVAVAHTADDQAETVLLRLARGAGPQGLGGMDARSQRDGLTILRPLLGLRHADLVAFLKQNRLRWREDASNRDVHFLRNRVRHELLPLIEKRLNPRIRDALLRTADVLRAEQAWLDELAAAALADCVGAARSPDAARRATVTEHPALAVRKLAALPLAARRRVVRLWLSGGGLAAERLDFDAVEAVLALLHHARGTQAAELGGGWRAVRRYRELVLESAPTPAAGWRLDIRPYRGILRERPTQPGRLPARATLSARAVGAAPLTVRAWRPGDRIRPLGMPGSKKLQDIFTDAKVPRDRRAAVPVVVCRGEIVWLPGYRVARGWAVPRANSPSLLVTVERRPARA